MEGKRTPKRVLEWKPTGRRNKGRPRKRWIEDIEEDIQIMGIRGWRKLCKRNRGRPRKRWIEDIEEDIQIMGIRGWRKLCKERAEWWEITEKAKTHSGL
jgi:hypothetical protein